MKIKVTRWDIRNAKEARRKFHALETWFYCRSENCPLAFALQRMYPDKVVRVLPWRIFIGEHMIDLSSDVKNFIAETDRKKDKIRPRELEI